MMKHELEVARKAVSEFQKYRPQIQEALLAFKRSIEPIAMVLKSIDATRLRQWLEAINEFQRKITYLKEGHEQDKVFFPPFFDEFVLGDVYGFFSDESKSPIKVYHELFMDKSNVDHLLSQWERNPYFQPRMRILRSALYAHIEEKYELSIVVLMREFEGILQDVFSINHKKIQNRISKFNQRGKNNGDIEDLMESIFAEAVCEEVFYSIPMDKDSNNIYPNRHRLLHGIDTNYYENEYFSTRLIMLIDFLRTEKFVKA